MGEIGFKVDFGGLFYENEMRLGSLWFMFEVGFEYESIVGNVLEVFERVIVGVWEYLGNCFVWVYL